MLPCDLTKVPTPSADSALYVHVPFCFHKCHYCDFYSITRQTPERMEKYVELVLREANFWPAAAGGARVSPRTVFIGGGTPTLLPIDAMQRLLLGLRRRFDFSGCIEWTVEANPATVTAEYCAMLFSHGVDRLSFGAQSFDRDELAALERHHHPDDVAKSLDLARRAGFMRLNLDLIYAIPGQDMASWSRSLDAAIDLGTSHLSCYGLTYEPNTPLAVKKRLGQTLAADEELELSMLRHARRRLHEAGMDAYEISNFAAASQECRHNLNYWTGGDYIALGPSGASHQHGVRWRNRPHLGEWEQAIEAGRLPAIECEQLSPRHRAGELAMLMLRLSSGIDRADFQRRSGYEADALFADPISRLGRAGLLDDVGGAIRLSDRGLVLADSIAAEFLAVVV